MALSDLTVFQEYVYSSMTELVAQEIEKFNAASQGTVILRAGDMRGDFSDVAKWQKIDGLVRRRNAYGSGAVTAKNLAHIIDTMVKVASGTPPVEVNPSQFTWIQKSPEEAGTVIGSQLAGDMLADMLNTAIMGAVAAMSQNAAMTLDLTATSGTNSYVNMNKAAALMGDRSQAIQAWLQHSTIYHDLIGENLANQNQLFKFESVVVNTDHLGRPLIITDSPSLIDTAATPDGYYSIGLTNSGVIVEQNNDFDDNYETSNGDENIARTYQAEWSYNLGVKGYAWDKTNGGKSPNDAALATSTNWDKYITSDKDGPGVLLKVVAA